MTMIVSRTHDVRLQARARLYQGSCSCGWASPDDPSPFAAAVAAVKHSTSRAGTTSKSLTSRWKWDF